MAQFVVIGRIVAMSPTDQGSAYAGPLGDTPAEAAENWYLHSCDNLGMNPNAESAESAHHEMLIDAKCFMEREPVGTEIAILDGDETLNIQELPTI